ncbi:Fic family protein [Marinomonas sp. BSi20584]|uniref:Fic family protein n=1 Tax=Marinomonas sp. BSi20584 TaxID=1594462 RepID=UPI000C1F0F63|nr:Fic family protein [Marinomonas sp. BSi20584]PJE55590.1 Fic family protein [Marinomonas sp. BSi20584]
MATPSEKLADALEALHQLQKNGLVAIRSAELSRTYRERLVQNGFLEEVIKGWYVPARPDETRGESTAWYASFWQFCAAYLNYLKGDDWCLSPEQSIALHSENMTVPKQLLVRAIKARNNVTALPHGTSLLDIRSSLPERGKVSVKNGLRIYSLSAALIACSKQSFTQNPTDMRAALSMISDASDVLEQLLDGGHSSIAGRLAGAFRNIGRNQIADDILSTMRAAGYDLRESDPFECQSSLSFSRREQSPYVNRLRLMWQDMREIVIEHFPISPSQTVYKTVYMKHVEDVYVTDAYHSLSIEGYRVTPELINRVRAGDWNPEQNTDDKERLNALAARGYWQAYQAVRKSIEQILDGHNAGEVVDNDHRVWYREMFAPGVTAGIHKPADLAGYRNAPVFIRCSMHTPPSKEAVRDAMPAFFELLQGEEDAAVRVVLGHFIFVYIHPYMDGNGRTGRFLMNAMLASGGYPWTIVPLEKRNDYMAALEEASTNQNIKPFAKFLGSLVQAALEGKAEPPLPRS